MNPTRPVGEAGVNAAVTLVAVKDRGTSSTWDEALKAHFLSGTAHHLQYILVISNMWPIGLPGGGSRRRLHLRAMVLLERSKLCRLLGISCLR